HPIPTRRSSDLTLMLEQHLAQLADALKRISTDIYTHPETGFDEHHAVDTLTTVLEDEGFSITRGVHGISTAFTATHEGPTSGPNIAILLEYDALPGLGHGCGHNLIAAGG